MEVEATIREAIVEELKRQAENRSAELTVQMSGDRLVVHGPIDLDDLTMVIMGSVAGGP